MRAQSALTTATWTSSNGGTYNANSGASASASDSTTAVSVSANNTSTSRDNMDLATVNNGVVYQGANWIQLFQQGPKSNPASQVVTFTLPTTAYCVTFYVNDIDALKSGGQSYVDNVVASSGFTASTTSPYIAVSGGQTTSTTTAPTDSSHEWANTSSANGLAKFTLALGIGITSFTLTYLDLYLHRPHRHIRCER